MPLSKISSDNKLKVEFGKKRTTFIKTAAFSVFVKLPRWQSHFLLKNSKLDQQHADDIYLTEREKCVFFFSTKNFFPNLGISTPRWRQHSWGLCVINPVAQQRRANLTRYIGVVHVRNPQSSKLPLPGTHREMLSSWSERKRR